MSEAAVWAFLLDPWPLTSGEEPVGVLDDGLDDAHDLQGDGGHHLGDVAAADESRVVTLETVTEEVKDNFSKGH